MFDPPALPPAGWYDDPDNPNGRRRWWNGRSWETPWGGPADGLPDIGEWLSRAFNRMWRHWRALAVIAALTGVPAGILASLAVRRVLDGVVIVDDDVIGWSSGRLPPAIALVVASGLLGGFGGLASTWLMLQAVDGDDNDSVSHVAIDITSVTTDSEIVAATRSIRAAIAMLPRAIGWLTLMMLIILGGAGILAVITVLVLPVGILLILACIPFAFFLAVRLAFVAQAVVDRPGNPFTRSAAVSTGRFWPAFGRMALIGVIVYGMSIAVNITTSIASGTGFGGGFGYTDQFQIDTDGTFESVDLSAIAPSNLAIGVGALAALISGVVISGLMAAAFAELYRTRNAAE